MKTKSIKTKIIWNFFISTVLAFILTTFVGITVFAAFEIVSQEAYANFLNQYNTDSALMLLVTAIGSIVFMINLFWIFSYRINSITKYIKELSENIHQIAHGNFAETVSVKGSDELSVLAQDINIMSQDIQEYIKNKQQWNDERYNIITNISHDLKTPIMSIDGYIDLVKHKKYCDLAEHDQYCDIISRKSKELDLAINQLFEFLKYNSNDLKIEKTFINLRQFVEQVLMSYIPVFTQNDMTYRIDVDGNMKIFADPQMMLRVFENIISNAVKYASKGKYLDIKSEHKDGMTVISFINYGPLLDESQLDKIFNKYCREKNNTENEGTGLGLTIAKAIVEQHNGNISVTSNPDQTVFKVCLN